MKCPETCKETFCKGINTQQFVVDSQMSVFPSDMFVYPLISRISHPRPSWPLNTRKKGSKTVKC